jgi:hypothetical protein
MTLRPLCPIPGRRWLSAAFFGNDDPENEVGNQAWQPARHEQDEKQQAKPKGTYPKELAQTTTYTRYHAIAP